MHLCCLVLKWLPIQRPQSTVCRRRPDIGCEVQLNALLGISLGKKARRFESLRFKTYRANPYTFIYRLVPLHLIPQDTQFVSKEEKSLGCPLVSWADAKDLTGVEKIFELHTYTDRMGWKKTNRVSGVRQPVGDHLKFPLLKRQRRTFSFVFSTITTHVTFREGRIASLTPCVVTTGVHGLARGG